MYVVMPCGVGWGGGSAEYDLFEGSESHCQITFYGTFRFFEILFMYRYLNFLEA